jgi:hypothetical protein
MRKITAFLLLMTFVGLLLLSLACGGSGYEGDDPKNKPAKEAAGIETPEEPATPPMGEPSPDVEPPAEEGEGG